MRETSLRSTGRSIRKVAIRKRKLSNYRFRPEARSSQSIWRRLLHLLTFLTGLNILKADVF